MKKRCLLFILLLVAMLALSACSERDFAKEQREMGKYQATFNYMGGEASKKSELITFYYPDALLKEPGAKHTGADTITPPTRESFTLTGWYTSYTEREGQEPLFNAEDKWDFNVDRMPSADLVLYARWQKQYEVEIFFNNTGTEFHSSKKYYLDVGATEFKDPGSSRPIFAGHTLLGYYLDPELTAEAVFPIALPEGESMVLYTKWVQGFYTVVRKESDLMPMGTSGNFYLLNDIEITSAWRMPSTFNGKIESENGAVISGITLNLDLTANTNDSFGLFGTLVNATISNITFKDCTVTIVGNTNYNKLVYYGFLAGSIEGGTISNLSFINCKIALTNHLDMTNSPQARFTLNAFAGKQNNVTTDKAYEGVEGITKYEGDIN